MYTLEDLAQEMKELGVSVRLWRNPVDVVWVCEIKGPAGTFIARSDFYIDAAVLNALVGYRELPGAVAL